MPPYKALRIAFFGAKTYPPEIGGIETHIYNLSLELTKLNVYPMVFVGNANQKNKMWKDKTAEIYRVYQAKNRYLLKISMVFPTLFLLRRLKKEIDIYHAHDSVFGFFLSIFGYRPLVYTAHGCAFLRSDWPAPIRQILKFMEVVVFKKADMVICVDYKTQEVIKKYRKKNVFIIPNGVHIERFKKLPRPVEYPKNKLIIFSSGRLIPTKGFQDLMDAYLMLKEKVKEKAELFIGGKGPLWYKLRKRASRDRRIHMLGYVPKIEPYFAHADIFVLPSHYEGFPFTLLEAMASRTACISTDVGDISRRFKNGEEILIVPPHDVKELSRALETLIINNELRKTLSHNAFLKIVKFYRWEKIAKETYNVYGLISRRK